MTTPKDAIKEILEGLDHKDEALWTEDGSPLVEVIQRLANDKTVTRAQINDALPGFVRKPKDSVAEEEQPEDEAGTEFDSADEGSVGEQAAGPRMDPVAAAPPAPEPEVDLDDLPENERHERLRAMAHQRVLNAEIELNKAKETVSEAQRAVVTAEQKHARALAVYSSKYPPMSAEEAIKVHLRRQMEITRERINGQKFSADPALNPVDITLRDRKRSAARAGGVSLLPRKAAVSY